MPRGFRELAGITADLGIEAWGHDLQDAFAGAADGLSSLLSGEFKGPQTLTRKIRVTSPYLPSLLVQFLNEIIYLHETQDFLPGKVTDLQLTQDHLTATLTGSTYDPASHTTGAHVKAATYHGLEIDQSAGRVTIKMIFDV